MILTDLLELPVIDADGNRLGRIVDARFSLTAPPGRHIAGAELVGLIVGPHSGASYRGYERADMNSPRSIAAFIAWRHRGTFLVLWRDVAVLGSASVQLREVYTRYSAALASSGS